MKTKLAVEVSLPSDGHVPSLAPGEFCQDEHGLVHVHTPDGVRFACTTEGRRDKPPECYRVKGVLTIRKVPVGRWPDGERRVWVGRLEDGYFRW
jgi:hypothetical protein